MIFFPLSQHVVFRLPFWPFCLNSSIFCIYLTLLLPLFSFSFPFLPYSSPFLPFSFTFSPFLFFAFSYFFPLMTSADIRPSPRGGGYFPIYRPLVRSAVEFGEVSSFRSRVPVLVCSYNQNSLTSIPDFLTVYFL